MRRKTLFGLALVLAACGGQPEIEIAPQSTAPAQTAPYDLEVAFDGLIAFVEDEVDSQKSLWALLVDADYQGTPGSDDLPPCVWNEVQAGSASLEDFPAHRTHIRFPEGEVEKCNQAGTCVVLSNPEAGEPIPAGADLRFETGLATTLSAQLGILASSSELQDTRGVPKPDADALDKLGENLLSTSPTHPHLSGRALLQTGTVESRGVPCGAGGVPDYSFRSPTDTSSSCLGSKGTKLAEETVWTQKGLQQPAIIKLGTGDEYRVWTTSGTAKVAILNVVQKAIGDPSWTGCGEMRHLEAFRWFYRLAKNAPVTNCADSYFPCEFQSPFGGRKCPQKLFQE